MQDETHGNKHTIIMMVNASEAVNNSRISCKFGDGVHSDITTLLVISGDNIHCSSYSTYVQVLIIKIK